MERQKSIMERQKSMEAGLLRKSLSIRERKHPHDDGYIETGLPSKRHPNHNESKKHQNEDDKCSVTSSVCLITFIVVTGSFCVGCGVGYSSVAQHGIVSELSLSVAEYSMFGSMLTLGGLIGAVFSGKISDVLGRKRTMLSCEVFCAIGWLCIAMAQDALWLDCGRLLLGIGVGIFSYVIPVYIAEIAPKHVRGSFVFANQLLQNCGLSLFFIIGNFISWRILSIVGMVPCVLHVIGLFFIPESPRWLAKCGRDKECRAALQQLRGHDVDISIEANAIRDTMEFSKQSGETHIMELFQKRYVYPLIIGVGLMLLQQLSGSSGVIYYASSLYERGGFPSAIGTSVMATIMIPKAMIGTIIVDKIGRRTLLMASCAGMGLFSLLLSVSYSFQSFGVLPQLTPIFTCISILGYVISYALGMGGLPWIIMSEIFPMNVKVSAGTLVTVTNWACGWIITFTFNFLMQWNAAGTFLFFSTVSAMSIMFIYFLVPETKGRSLEEIQTLLSSSVH
uniref:Sugar transporter ERD6 n=2 Tax=Noccaea caerulescens TaxID=107243 RepID=A0A1J3GUW2_NOCCA